MGKNRLDKTEIPENAMVNYERRHRKQAQQYILDYYCGIYLYILHHSYSPCTTNKIAMSIHSTKYAVTDELILPIIEII